MKLETDQRKALLFCFRDIKDIDIQNGGKHGQLFGLAGVLLSVVSNCRTFSSLGSGVPYPQGNYLP